MKLLIKFKIFLNIQKLSRLVNCSKTFIYNIQFKLKFIVYIYFKKNIKRNIFKYFEGLKNH